MDQILNLSTGLGIFLGSLITLIMQSLLRHQDVVKQTEFEFKKTRYLCLIVLMMTMLDTPNPAKRIAKIMLHRPELKSIEDVKEEIEAEYYNAYLYASDDVLMLIELFLSYSSKANYLATVNAMRKDLWGSKSKKQLRLEVPVHS